MDRCAHASSPPPYKYPPSFHSHPTPISAHFSPPLSQIFSNMSGWNVDTTTFTDLLQSDGSQTPHVDDLSPTHRRSNVGSSPQPRVLYSAGIAPPGQYGPYGPLPGQYGSFRPPSYPYPQPPPPHAPPTGSGTLPPYAAPSYGSYPPPPPEVSALSSASDAAETVLPKRPKRL